MAEINLLPREFKPDVGIVNLSKNLRKISIVGFIIFIVGLFVSVGSYFLLTNLLTTSSNNQDNLKTQIKNLSQTEQQLYLVEDRLKKIQGIQDSANAGSNISLLENVLQGLPPGASFYSTSINKDYLDVTIGVDGSGGLSKLLATLINSGSFKNVEMNSFTYRPGTGYQVQLFLTQ